MFQHTLSSTLSCLQPLFSPVPSLRIFTVEIDVAANMSGAIASGGLSCLPVLVFLSPLTTHDSHLPLYLALHFAAHLPSSTTHLDLLSSTHTNP